MRRLSSSLCRPPAQALKYGLQPGRRYSFGLSADEVNRLHPGYRHPVARKWQGDAECTLTPAQLMYPVFVTESIAEGSQEVPSLPEQRRWAVDSLPTLLEPLMEDGLQSVILFGVTDHKSPNGDRADAHDGPVLRAIEHIRRQYPELYIAADVCLCGYTPDGHCGFPDQHGGIDSLATISRLAEISKNYADAGAHMVAPSDMMDSRIASIRAAIPEHVTLMSYSAKFCSAMYGPFRDAAGSGCVSGDRSGYQLPITSRRLALRAMERDEAEGADILLVKPAGPYLDIIRDAAETSDLPIAAYQVSGEYSMLYRAAEAEVFKSLEEGVMESLIGMRRAGADLILTYFTPQVLRWLKAQK